MSRARAPSVFADVGGRFITENRGVLQKYRVEHLIERAKLFLDNRLENSAEQAFEVVKKAVRPLLTDDLNTSASGSISNEIIDLLFEVPLPSEEIGSSWAAYERLAIAVQVLAEMVELSQPLGNVDQNTRLLNIAEELSQAACLSYMEYLFPGRYTDIERLAELAMLTGFGLLTQAFDGKIPDAVRPLVEGVMSQPGFLGHAEAAVKEIQGVGKKGVASAGAAARHAATNAARVFAIERYRNSPERWNKVSEAAREITVEVFRRFGNEVLSESNGERTVTDWLRPYFKSS